MAFGTKVFKTKSRAKKFFERKKIFRHEPSLKYDKQIKRWVVDFVK